MRSTIKGILGTKLGMTQVLGREQPRRPGDRGPGRAVRGDPGPHPGQRRLRAVQLAFGAIDPRKVNKPRTGHFAKAGVTPRRHLVELRTDDAGEYTVGQEVTAEVFEAGAVGRRRRHEQGQGHRGCHEAARLPRPRREPRHPAQAPLAGLDRRLRHPGRVFKGLRMAGRMGTRAHHRQNLTVHAVDAEKG